MARVLKLTPGESVEVRQSTPELLEVEATYSRTESPPPKHFHPSQDEHFEVLAGTMRARVGDEKRTLGEGDTLAFGVYLTEYRDVFRLAVAPDLILRPVFGVLGLIGRARGYSPTPAA